MHLYRIDNFVHLILSWISNGHDKSVESALIKRILVAPPREFPCAYGNSKASPLEHLAKFLYWAYVVLNQMTQYSFKNNKNAFQ